MTLFGPVENFLQPFTRNLSGYICVTRANRSSTDEEANKGWSESQNYYLPVDNGEVDYAQIYLDLENPAYLEWEWYFTPAIFSRPRRRLEDFKASNALWLDFDTEVPWVEFDPEPSFVVQSRPGPAHHPDRCQTFWILDEPITDQFKLRHLNRTAFHYFGCDDESCVTPQHLMKLPFGRNLKLAAQLEDGTYWAPKLTQATGEVFNVSDFEVMPDPPENTTLTRTGAMVVPDTLPSTDGKTWDEWLNELRGRIPQGLQSRISVAPPPGEITRSENLYGIIASLLDYLVPEDIFRVVCGSPNDKFTAKHGSVRGPVYLWSDIHRIWDKTSSGKPDSDLILPDEFWESRNFLRTIRQAAHSRCTSADTVLACTLARLSSMVDHRVHLDTGLGRSPLNMFCILLGATGVGKGASMKAAEDILRLPVSFVTSMGSQYVDGASVGSGEGIAEAFIGEVNEKGPDGKKAKVRKQIRHNAYLTADEGKAFAIQAGRKGATLVPTVCSAWSGSTLGQMNATAERTRHVPGNSYSLGIAIGFQEATVLPILDEIDTGLPQRFLWLHCLDPNIPEEPMDEPMLPLGGVLTKAPEHTITFATSIKQELWHVRRQRSAGTLEIPVERSQEPLMLCKVAGLLAMLDGRSHVDTDDWELSKTLWETSLKVMDSAWSYHKIAAARKRHEQQQQAVQMERVKEVARHEAVPALEKIAKKLASTVHKDGRTTRGVLRSKVTERQRELVDQALDYAVSEGWIQESGTKAFMPGRVVPPNDSV